MKSWPLIFLVLAIAGPDPECIKHARDYVAAHYGFEEWSDDQKTETITNNDTLVKLYNIQLRRCLEQRGKASKVPE